MPSSTRLKRTSKFLFLLLLPFWCALLGATAAAQSDITAQNAREGALGGCLLFEPGVGLVEAAYSNGFLAAGMDNRMLRLQFPVGRLSTLRFEGSAFGNEDYMELKGEAMLWLRLSSWMQLGAGAKWLHVGFSDPHYRSPDWVEAGLAILTRWKKSGALLQIESRNWDHRHPFGLRLQAHYLPLPGLMGLVQYDMSDCRRWRLGMEYNHEQWLAVRGGLATNPLVLTFGLGARYLDYALDLGVEVHRWLGLSPRLSLSWWL